MTTEASRRLHLHETARQTWGAEAANTLMELLPPEPDSLATRADVAMVTADLRAEIAVAKADLRTEIGMAKAELRTEIGDLRSEMADFRVEMYKALSEQTRTLVLANAGMMLTTVGLSFAVARIG